MHAMISIDAIEDNNQRSIQATEEQDKALGDAILMTNGPLYPPLVRPMPNGGNGYQLMTGSRRLRAMKALGMTEIMVDVREDLTPELAHAADSMTHQKLHPVDQWRAVDRLMTASAMDAEQAARVIGLDATFVRRFRYLSHMAPAVLDALGEQPELPQVSHLRTIALATHERQEAAIATARGKANYIDWYNVAEACTARRFYRKDAIFNVEESGIAWDEDWLAETDDTRFTTTDRATFMSMQAAAAMAMADASKGRIQYVDLTAAKWLTDAIPKGWVRSYDKIPLRWKKTDPRRVFIGVRPHDGILDRALCQPLAETVRQEGGPEQQDRPPAERLPVTKVGLDLIAHARCEALRQRLDVFKDNGPADMLRVVLMLLACKNVHTGAVFDTPPEAVLVTQYGLPREGLTDDIVCALAAELVGQIVQFDSPGAYRASGMAAEWVAEMISCPPPRFDTEEILKTVSLDTLRTAARQAGLPDHGTGAVLRKRIVGKMPDFAPPVLPNVVGPTARVADDDEGDDA